MHTRKRSASVAFPTVQSTNKVPRRAASSPSQQQELMSRWSDTITSVLHLALDTFNYVVGRTLPDPSSPTKSQRHELLTPPTLAAESTATASLLSTQTSSDSSDDSLPIPLVSKARDTPVKSDASNDLSLHQKPRRPSKLAGTEGVRKPYQRRPHIHAHLHKEAVKERRKQELYLLERNRGYSSDFATFKSLLAYRHQVHKATQAQNSALRNRSTSRRSSTSSIELVEQHINSIGLQRALARAKESLSGPGPAKPFVPSFEQLRIADKARDSAIDKRVRPPLPEKLPPQAQSEVNQHLSDRQFISKVGREQVAYQDIQRLRPGKWLNDEIINFYGQLIVDRSEKEEAGKENINTSGLDKSGKRKTLPLRVHYFNTFFWPKVQTGYAKSNLRKWTKKVDIFSKDAVLIPINHSQTHWSAAVINFAKKRIESYDSLDGSNSMKSHLFENLRAYLQEEHRDKKGKDFDFTSWQNYGRSDTPQQENGVDCGVFTMQFLETVARNEEIFAFSQSDMPYLRQRMIWEIGRAKLGCPP